MKSVMISIRPKWVEKIASGKKTVEVRKIVPKCGAPFKVYIYCTKEGRGRKLRLHINDKKGREDVGITTWWRDGKDVLKVNDHLPAYRFNSYLAEGKVVGEFVCDKLTEYTPLGLRGYELLSSTLKEMCLSKKELDNYGRLKHLYGLHISDLKIYDKPKELSEFVMPCDKSNAKCITCKRFIGAAGLTFCNGLLTRPPQSWCYVEEL